MDNNFYHQFISSVARQYPQAKDLLGVLFSKISLIVENGIDLSYCNDLLNSSFDIKELGTRESNFTTIFIGKNLGDKSIRAIHQNIPHKENDFLFIIKDKNKLFVIIKTNDESKIKLAIEKLKNLKDISMQPYTEDL